MKRIFLSVCILVTSIAVQGSEPEKQPTLVSMLITISKQPPARLQEKLLSLKFQISGLQKTIRHSDANADNNASLAEKQLMLAVITLIQQKNLKQNDHSESSTDPKSKL